MAEIPGVRRARLWEKKWVAELLSAVPPIIASSVAASALLVDVYTNSTLTKEARQGKYWLAGFLFCAIIWSIVSAVIRIKQGNAQDKEQKSKTDHEGLIGSLYVVHNLINVKALMSKPKTGNWLGISFV